MSNERSGASPLSPDPRMLSTESVESLRASGVATIGDRKEILNFVRSVIPPDMKDEDVEGSILWRLVEDKYFAKVPLSDTNGTLFLCNAEGGPQVRRDISNKVEGQTQIMGVGGLGCLCVCLPFYVMRAQRAVVVKYCIGFLKRGFQARCRGALMVRKSVEVLEKADG